MQLTSVAELVMFGTCHQENSLSKCDDGKDGGKC